MRALPALALVAAAIVLAGCSGEGGTADASPPEKREKASTSPKQDVAWLVLLRQWRRELVRKAELASRIAKEVQSGTRKSSELERAVQPLTECSRSLDEEVSEPNAARYLRSYDLYGTVCEGVADWARALADEKKTKRREARIETLFTDADMQLESSLLAFKPLPTLGGKVSRSRIEPRLGRALSKLAFTRSDAAAIEVRCWSKKDWPLVKLEWGAVIGTVDFAGFAYEEYRVSLAPEYCAALVRLVYGRERPKRGIALWMTAASVGLLAHEGHHLFAYEGDEARTECYAAQSVRGLAPILGTSRTYADGLAEVYWKYVYPREPAEYRTSACRDGGPLDLNPRSDVWP